jgi:hypothetical protein
VSDDDKSCVVGDGELTFTTYDPNPPQIVLWRSSHDGQTYITLEPDDVTISFTDLAELVKEVAERRGAKK